MLEETTPRFSLKRSIVCVVIAFSFVISALIAISSSVDGNGGIGWFSASLKMLVVMPLIAGVILLSFYARSRVSVEYQEDLADFSRSDRLKKKLVRTAILLVFWLPYAIALYPGVLTFDTSFQLCQFFGSEMPGIFPGPSGYDFTNHHPLFVTLLFGFVVYVGELLTGSYNVACFLLSVLLAMFTAFSASCVLDLLDRLAVKRSVRVGTLLFFALFPVFPFFALTPCKDSLFTPLFILFSICIFDLSLSSGDKLRSKRCIGAFVLLSILMILSKKTGLYIFLLIVLILLVLKGKNKIRLVSSAVCVVVVSSVLFPAVLFPVLNVYPGSKIEMMGPLYQQTARYVSCYPDDLSEAERHAVDEVLGFDGLRDRYNFTIVDTVIHDYDKVDVDPSLDQILDYLSAYVSMGLKHPGVYFESFFALERGWCDLDERMLFAEGSGLQLDPPNGIPRIDRSPDGAALASKVSSFASWIASVPGLNVLFCPVVYTVLLPAISFLLVWRTQARGLVIPIFASLPFLFLSPVSLCSSNIEAMRYLLPFVYSAPLLFSVSFGVNFKSSTMHRG